MSYTSFLISLERLNNTKDGRPKRCHYRKIVSTSLEILFNLIPANVGAQKNDLNTMGRLEQKAAVTSGQVP